MIETMDNMVLCGVMYINDTPHEIYCDKYGTAVFESYDDGCCWCLTEINVSNPFRLNNVTPIINNLNNDVYGPAIGVIMSDNGDVIVLLDEDYAVVRDLGDLQKNLGEPFYYSTDVEYEPDYDDVEHEGIGEYECRETEDDEINWDEVLSKDPE